MPFPFSDTPDSAAPGAALRIDSVLFDYGQVLSNPPDPKAWARLLAITGVDEARLHAAYWKFRHDYDRGALTGPAYWNAVAAEAGITFEAAQIKELLAADLDLWSSLNLPMVEWAARLQHAGVRTGILSNIGDSMAEGLIARFPWLSGFDQCIWSYELLMAKPEPAIFLRTAEALHTAPANILFIDDREDNIVAARTLGMQVIRYTNYGAFEREMRQRGLSSLLDVGLESNRPATGRLAQQPTSTASAAE
jgi:putative hydrolase of the HAD superfamily